VIWPDGRQVVVQVRHDPEVIVMAEQATFWPQALGIPVSHLASVSEAIEIGEAAVRPGPAASSLLAGTGAPPVSA
jgi:hypothetical protein